MQYTVVILLACAAFASACTPAQKENIDRLKKHFGIEPFYPNGEFATNGYTDDFIKQASDLNCNFNTPETPSTVQGSNAGSSNVAALCKWKNMKSEDAPTMDTEQFFLFTKTVEKNKWNLLKPNRGAAKQTPAVGDGFALTGGDKAVRGKPNPQAILYSSPLKCLENEAELSFDYWLYSAAGVRVMLMEKDTLDILYEIPKKDRKLACTRFNPRTGRCVVKVPAQTKPFHLAIHGFNLASKFLIIDNIEFAGELGPSCIENTDPFDFGTTKQPLPSRENAAPITIDSDLNTNGGTDAKWSNSGKGTNEFEVHTGPVDVDKWTAATGDTTVPDGDFFMARGNDGTAELMSDIIDCQQNDGILTFEAWASQNTQLEVCVVKSDTLETLYACEQVFLPMGNSPFSVVIFGPLDNARIMFVASDWDSGNGGFVAIDSIAYEATMCLGSPTEAPPTDPDTVDIPACVVLSTNFNDETLTTSNWKSFSEPTYQGLRTPAYDIATSFSPTANTMVECPDGSKCAGLLLDKTQQLELGIMESPEFELVQDRYMEMVVRRGTYKSMAHMCFNALPDIDDEGSVVELNGNCQVLAGPELKYSEYRNGKVVGVTVPKETTKIFLVFTNQKTAGAEKAGFLVDDIRVLKGTTDNSGPLCAEARR